MPDPQTDELPNPPPTVPASAATAAQQVNEHLANERTFLAWVRTGLAMIGFGFVMARVGLFLRQLAYDAGAAPSLGTHPAHDFAISGIVFMALGTLLTAWSAWHYQRTRRAILTCRFSPANLAVVVVTVLLVSGGVISIGMMIRGITP